MGPAARPVCLALLLGWMHCAPAQEALYRLPWPEGRTFMFSQAPGGLITTHVTKDSLYAVDIPMPEGTPVLAAREGVVLEAEWRHGSGDPEDPLTDSGNYVLVRHADGSVATYAHLMFTGVAVEAGEPVEAGRVLGYSGTTGFSTGPHLHFGVARAARAGEPAQEMSVPLTFYIGNPPLRFAPRAALIVTADYGLRAAPPRFARDPRPLVEWTPRALPPEELLQAWAQLAAWLAAGIAGMLWFYRFSRS